MKTTKNVITIFSFFVLFLNSSFSYSSEKQINFEVIPSEIFVSEDASILFKARYSSSSPKPKTLSLVEWNQTGSEIKYHWELMDDGSQGDEVANDSIFSRVVQFKEKKIKTLSFWVTEEKLADNTNPTSVFLHKTSPQLSSAVAIPENQKATLNIISRPTFQEILKNAYQKFMNKLKS